MTRNVELLERTMQHILDHPEVHNQGQWIIDNECGTAACFAGWAALLSGWSYQQVEHCFLVDFAELLGLTRFEACLLFDVRNSRPMLELMVKDLVNGDEMRSWLEYQDEAEN